MQKILLGLYQNIKKIIQTASRLNDIMMEKYVSVANFQNTLILTIINAYNAILNMCSILRIECACMAILSSKPTPILKTFFTMEILLPYDRKSDHKKNKLVQNRHHSMIKVKTNA